MKTYLKAYRERLIRNTELLKELGLKLQEKGFIVQVSNKTHFQFMRILNSDKTQGVRLEFNEVPYRWSLHYSIKPSKERGSSVLMKEIPTSENEIPFTVEEIIKYIGPYYVDRRFDFIYKPLTFLTLLTD